ncbi:transmembrane protein 19-like isoform X2 [Ornithodoros turicata]|uniref:transmembrane protein 19-like isoform X2 n=1 Tax=Ornithodoros turicata TaxID=34597 RepID=UPI003139692A
MILVGLLAITLPISLVFWTTSVISSWYSEDVVPPSPLRWFTSLFVPLAFAVWGYRKRSLNLSGALTGFGLGFVLTFSNYSFLAALVTFFVSSSKATKYRSARKRKFEPEFKEGGQRNWVQVLCNGGVATELALLYVLECGVGEKVINPRHSWLGSMLALGVMSALAESCGDTWASELGTVCANGDPYLVTTFRRVPKGTNGGVSLTGTVFSALGGALVGSVYYLTLLLCVSRDTLVDSPPQWPLVVAGAAAGLLGSFIDSVLGATLQYTVLGRRTRWHHGTTSVENGCRRP